MSTTTPPTLFPVSTTLIVTAAGAFACGVLIGAAAMRTRDPKSASSTDSSSDSSSSSTPAQKMVPPEPATPSTELTSELQPSASTSSSFSSHMLAASSSVSRPSASPPKFYLIIFNIAKKANLGTLLRSACAFGVHEVLVVGQRKALQTFGNKGTVQHLSFREFDSLPLLGSWLKEHHIEVVGIEIIEGATSVSKHRFRGDTAFMLGNEGTGLSKKQIGFCDRFMYIPHAGNGTASLNVAVAGSIVLHHFSEWAGK
mmetsp:Transcript_14121/g.42533  ORF Transcript_14121/g.42533 Transcript_14121/m.42533 type:complete len:256 (+) Transcript_14121:12-779(+)